jgi:hypothetical protein
MITLVFIALAALCNAVMDTCAHHFNDSIFSHMGLWWGPESWRNKYRGRNPRFGRRVLLQCRINETFTFKINYPVVLTDAWHFFKSGMICLLIAAIFFYKPMYGWIDFLIYGGVWNITFFFFYTKIFR